MDLKLIIFLLVVIVYSFYSVYSAIHNAWDFWKREYDSAINKNEEFYKEFEHSKKWFIKHELVGNAIGLFIIVTTVIIALL